MNLINRERIQTAMIDIVLVSIYFIALLNNFSKLSISEIYEMTKSENFFLTTCPGAIDHSFESRAHNPEAF